MVSDQEIASCVETLLRQQSSDPANAGTAISLSGVVHQIVKQLWAYIRKNNLQDPNNKRKIICNDELRVVFETDCTDMFKMNKLLSKHIIPLNEANLGPDCKKLKTKGVDSAELDDGGQPAVVSSSEQKPAVVSGSEHPEADTASEQYVVISDALAIFFGY